MRRASGMVRLVVATAAVAAALVHGAAVGAHGDHVGHARLLLAAAVAGGASGVACLITRSRSVLFTTAVLHSSFVVVWLLSRTVGLPGVDGLESAEPVRFADAAAAGLAVVVVVGCVSLLLYRPSLVVVSRPLGLGTAALVVALAVPALADASTEEHSHEAPAAAAAEAHPDGGPTAEADHPHPEATDTLDAAADEPVPAPFDPAMPIDLSGTPGVSASEQAEAELLVARTIEVLPRYADQAAARAAGYQTIGDAFTGDEHLINWSLLDDGHVLDPERPESLVYRVMGGRPQLEAAMFILPETSTLADAPPFGGELVQWHVHDDLCFSPWPSLLVSGLTSIGGPCPTGLVKFPARPMVHVWIVPNPCGPFAALEGIGAGQVRDGETRACDHAHGAGS